MTAPADTATMRFAEEIGDVDGVAVEGSMTRWSTGGELDARARTVKAPTGILDHQPEEMTVGVRAGTTVRDLHARLAESGQRTALPDRGGTVGGAIAVGENALGVQGCGPVRSAVLQVRYVSAEGRVITGGGPTVKNVTGFDLPRLMVGALGTLGLIAEVILRTNPIPAVSVWMESDDVGPVHRASTAPQAVSGALGRVPDLDRDRRPRTRCRSGATRPGAPRLVDGHIRATPAAASPLVASPR